MSDVLPRHGLRGPVGDLYRARETRPQDREPSSIPATVPKPMIAAINGACAGLGLNQALMCDVRFAGAGVKFTTAFSRRGIMAEHAIAWTLPRIISHGRAMDLLLSARVFLAEEAFELGLVNKVVPREQVVEAAIAYARDRAKNCSPAAMATMKRRFATRPPRTWRSPVLSRCGCGLRC